MVECPFLNWLNNEKAVENLFKQTVDQCLVVEIIQKLKHNFLSPLKSRMYILKFIEQVI